MIWYKRMSQIIPKKTNILALALKHLRQTRQSEKLSFAFSDQWQDDAQTDMLKTVKRQKPALCVGIRISGTQSISGSLKTTCASQNQVYDLDVEMTEVSPVSLCLKNQLAPLNALQNGTKTVWSKAYRLLGCVDHRLSHLTWFSSYTCIKTGKSVFAQQCDTVRQARSENQRGCHVITPSASEFTQSLTDICVGIAPRLSGYLKNITSRAVPVPCEWYEIAVPEPVPELLKRCNRIKANCLPLTLDRKRVIQSPRQILFPFACYRAKALIPPLDSYMILNKIVAFSGNLKLNPLSASFSCDTSGYYWTGEITLPPDDFIALNLAQYNQGKEPLITLKINDDTFTFLAENFRDNRQFGHRSYTISGRSETARLGSDYATLKNGVIETPQYARQIADSVLADTGFKIATWQIPDWLIPERVYSLTDKTPITVIADIAQAAGGFLMSDTERRLLHVKARYKVPAWKLVNAQPDVSIPANVIVQISGQKSISTQCFGVFVCANHGEGVARKIVRKASSGSPEASALTHTLYTDDAVCLSAGTAALSDTGASKTETIELPVMPKYALERARLGDIWQVNEATGAWIGIVQSVRISVQIVNNAPKVMQSVEVWRYLGK